MRPEDNKWYPFAMAIKMGIEQLVESANSSTFLSIKESLDEFECEVGDAEFGRVIFDGIRAAIERREAKDDNSKQKH
jgi:hypothetical protein